MHHAPGFACVIKEESSGGSAGCAGPPPPPPATRAPPHRAAAAPAPRYFAGKKGRSRPRPRRGARETAPGGAATEQDQVVDFKKKRKSIGEKRCFPPVGRPVHLGGPESIGLRADGPSDIQVRYEIVNSFFYF